MLKKHNYEYKEDKFIIITYLLYIKRCLNIFTTIHLLRQTKIFRVNIWSLSLPWTHWWLISWKYLLNWLLWLLWLNKWWYNLWWYNIWCYNLWCFMLRSWWLQLCVVLLVFYSGLDWRKNTNFVSCPGETGQA